jgi:hypothetical protein
MVSIHLFEGRGARFLKLIRVPDEPSYILGGHVGLVLNKDHCFGRFCELGEEKGFIRLGEETVLSFLAVMIHAVPQNCKIDVRLFQEHIVLVVSVGIHEGHHAPDQARFLLLVELEQELLAKHFVYKALDYTLHLDFANFRKTDLLEVHEADKVCLVLRLVELIHCAKTSSQEEKVELLHLFVAPDDR